MKKLLIIVVLTCGINVAWCQSFYEIKELGTSYSAQQIDSAFQSADFCGMYYGSERRGLIFDDGTIVELYSSVELPNLPISCFISSKKANDSNIWRISADGYLLRAIQTPTVKQ